MNTRVLQFTRSISRIPFRNVISLSSHGPSSWNRVQPHCSHITSMEVIDVVFNILSTFTNSYSTWLSLAAAVYLLKCRKDIEMLQLKLKKKDESLRVLQKEHKPMSAVYGFVALKRLEERMTYQIRYLTMALESVPQYYTTYAKLQRELERLQLIDSEIDDAKRAYFREFNLSDQNQEYQNQMFAIESQLLRGTSSNQCPLEELLSISPIENTFWNNGSSSQKRKLEKEYSKLKYIYPGMSETKLRTTMVYVYNHFKRDIFSLHSKKLERLVRKLTMESEELENYGNNEEEAELCSICLEEMYSDEIITLDCNHLFHRNCINPWLERDVRCPMCRCPQARRT